MKTAVITGISKGIGLATAKKFLDEGWKVIGTYLGTVPILSQPNLSILQYNQEDHRSVVATVNEIKHSVNKIDVLINNAGILLDGKDSVAIPDKIEKTLKVNLVGLIDFTELLLPLMQKGSHIVNLSSKYGSFCVDIDDETSIGYRISKAGLNMYTRHLAFRLKGKGVLVSSIRPGWVKTDMGYILASDTEKPDKEPKEAAEDIFSLVNTVTETGQFWDHGKKHNW